MHENAPALHKAELYLCLARAFAVPNESSLFDALRDDLPGDLEDLGSRLGYPIGFALAEFRQAIAGIGDAQQLLVLYSRLFLVPGEHHPSLNTGAYLDGTIAGSSVTALETCYARCGLDKRGDFHDLPDHLSVQLELVAWLLAAEVEAESQGGLPPPMRAREILVQFVARWVGPFRTDIEAASRRFGLGANPYLALARFLEAAVLAEVGVTRGEAQPSPGIDPEIARLRSQYAGREMSEEDLAIIRARLAADGLPSGHVTIPVDARDRTMGLAAMTPPAPPTHRLDPGA
jgi:putative dimethyl sulfoxide reductase chaperone